MHWRPLPVLAVALLLGALAGSAAAYLPVSISIVAVLVLGVLFLCCRAGCCSPFFSCLIFGVFLAGGISAILTDARTGRLSMPATAENGKADLIGEIVEPVRYGPGRASATVSVHTLLTTGRDIPVHGRIKLSLRGDVPPLIVGDLIRFQTIIRPPHALRNPAGFDYAEHLRRSGIQAVGAVTIHEGTGDLQILTHRGSPVMGAVDGWRRRLREAALRSLPSQEAGIYLALITGETGYLTAFIRDIFMASGTTHILSISGSHLGLISIVIFWAARRVILALPTAWLLPLSLRATATMLATFMTIVPVTLYALLGGAEVATVRSLVMLGIFVGAILAGREPHLGNALSMAVLLIVAWSPLAPFDLSFQLSFLSVLAIVLFVFSRRPLERGEDEDANVRSRRSVTDGLREGTWELFLVGIVVSLVTAPLVAWHFNQLPWMGVFSNLLIVPLVGFAIVPLGLLACVATLVSGSEGLVGALILQPCLEGLVWMVHGFAALPGAEWRVASPGMWQIMVFYVLLIFAFIFRESWRGRVSFLCALGLLSLWAISLRDLPEQGAARITFMDVGQGDAALVETPGGQTMLIDGGGASETFDLGRAVVAPLLWNRGIRHLDVVIATHPQLDHIGGLAFIAKHFEVGEFWTNGMTRPLSFVTALEETLEERHVPVTSVSDLHPQRSLGGCSVTVLNPRGTSPMGLRSTDGKALNNASVVVQLICGQTGFLFTGDMEREAEAALARSSAALNSAVIKVPHHGSRGAVHEEFLGSVRPRLAVISVGGGNSYGHPHSATLNAYERLGAAVVRTDRHGAVTVSSGPSGLTIVCETGSRLRRVKPGQGDMEGRNFSRLLGRMSCRDV